MPGLLKKYSSALLQLAFPQVCICCGKDLEPNRQHICALCTISLPYTGYWQMQTSPLLKQLQGRLKLVQAVAFLHFGQSESVRILMHALKYRGNIELGIHLGRMFATALCEQGSVFYIPDLIVPMPLHPKREKQRGYNQSECIAAGMSEVWNIPYNTKVVQRTKFNLSQTRKGRYDRWENVSNIFELMADADIAGKEVLLLDDVVTTGSTLESCGSVLLKAGVRLSVATLCTAANSN